jgi:hypothetical protein
MKYKLVCSSLFFLASIIGFAQNDFRPGYVMMTSKDTIFGKINYQNNSLLARKCEFKDESESVCVYYPDQIFAFRFVDGRYFISNSYNNRKVFLEYLIDGIADLYYLEDETGDHFFIEKDSLPLTELLYKETIKVINGKQFLTESKGYVNQLRYFMQDAQGILPQIEAIRKPQHKELINLAEDYHSIVCKDESCIIYDKGAPFLKITLEPFFGVGKLYQIEKIYLISGMYVNLQSSYEKKYFRTGLLHYEGDIFFDEDSTGGGIMRVTQIPLQAHYMIGNGWIKPRLGIGYDLMIVTTKTGSSKSKPDYLLTPNLNLGVMIKMTYTTDLSLGVNIQRAPVFFAPFQTSLDLGVRFHLDGERH